MPSFGTGTDCSALYHGYDTVDQCDVHRIVDPDTGSGSWDDCDQNPCPNRYTVISEIPPEASENGRIVSIRPIDFPLRVGRASNPTSSRASPAPISTALPNYDPDSEPEPEPQTAPEHRSDSDIEIETTVTSIPENPIPLHTSTMSQQPTIADVVNVMAQMSQTQRALQNTVRDMTKAISTNKGVSKPQNYDGKRSEEARRFLPAFELWSQGVPDLVADEQKRIQSAISFLEGEAAIWATPIAENISQVVKQMAGITLAYPTWQSFIDAFKARFETVDAVGDAKAMLETLWQGKNTVASYASTFKQYSSRTRYSDTDL